jgi:UDP-N-acetylglucosamine--N-acetylmuramyl-(pentapeptide) pyrophosphoryl-undecaprenol N-acetylglucosamine transferase
MSRPGLDTPVSQPSVHLVTSSGGHIDLLRAIRKAFDGYSRLWVVQPSLRAEAIKAEGEAVHVLPPYDRHPIRGHFASNIAQAAKIVLRDRPRVVVTSGAGITVPFCVFARLMGAKIIFVETMARVTGPSASGRVLSRLASRSLVQWPEAVAAYPRARLCRAALLESVPPASHSVGSGTFVTVGTHNQQFNRLLAMVDVAVGAGVLPTPVVAQGGSSTYRPRNYELRDWLSPEEVEAVLEDTQYVVSHGGSGLVSAALRTGHRPLVLPRLAVHHEHFDDHQTQIVGKLDELGLVVRLGEAITEANLRAADAPLEERADSDESSSVEAALREELEKLIGPPERTPLFVVAVEGRAPSNAGEVVNGG